MDPHFHSSHARNASSDAHRTSPESRSIRQEPDSYKSMIISQELERAKSELDAERHKPLGFMDDIKNLFGWIETPEERLHRNRPDLVE